MKLNKLLVSGIFGVMAVSQAQAATVVGGSTLLNGAQANQLESWLGEGNITLTNIFTKSTGNTASNFHSAADGQGRTFVLMSATLHGVTSTIGGYSPVSWNSTNLYSFEPNPANRTGFVFNLSDGVSYSQRTTAFSGGSYAGIDSGIYTAYNYPTYGPTFGGGHDIHVDNSLSSGYSFMWSYLPHNAPTCSSYPCVDNFSLVDGSPWMGEWMQVGALEVFTISANPVPEPETYAMLLAGLGLLGFAARRRKLKQTA